MGRLHKEGFVGRGEWGTRARDGGVETGGVETGAVMEEWGKTTTGIGDSLTPDYRDKEDRNFEVLKDIVQYIIENYMLYFIII